MALADDPPVVPLPDGAGAVLPPGCGGRRAGAVGPVQDNVRGQVLTHGTAELRVKSLQILAVDIDARVALRIDVQLAAVGGQVTRPAAVVLAGAIVLVRQVERAIAIAIVAEQQLPGDALDLEQLLDAVGGAVAGVVGGAQARVIAALSAAVARRVVGVVVVEDGVGNLLRHVGQQHEHVGKGLSGGIASVLLRRAERR